jgi:hypothetical protein
VAGLLPPLALRYERRVDVHEAFLTLGCALITWRYLKRKEVLKRTFKKQVYVTCRCSMDGRY